MVLIALDAVLPSDLPYHLILPTSFGDKLGLVLSTPVGDERCDSDDCDFCTLLDCSRDIHIVGSTRATWPWFATFYSLLMIGLVVGGYFGFYFDYMVASKVRVISFPVPSMFYVLESHEDGTQRWVDFVTPMPLVFAGSNVIIFACVSVLPISLFNLIRQLTDSQS